MSPGAPLRRRAQRRTVMTLSTSLFELIATVQEIAGPGNDGEVVAAVWHLLEAGRATWQDERGELQQKMASVEPASALGARPSTRCWQR